MASAPLAVTGLLVLCLAVTAFVLAMLVSQRAHGHPPPAVEDAYRQAQAIDGLQAELRQLRDSAARRGAEAAAVRELEETISHLEEAGAQLRRTAERVV